MSDNTYTTRELEAHFGDVKESLTRIEQQVIKTNGRVSSLENWRWFVTGGLAVISILVIPMVIYIFTSANKIQEKVLTGINQALSTYEIEVK